LYDVQKGQILIDRQHINQVKQDSLRDALAVVPQEITLFHRTIMENIRFARPDASDEAVFGHRRRRTVMVSSDGLRTDTIP
jgi:ATP-binding cassette, subfamily B, bacterial